MRLLFPHTPFCCQYERGPSAATAFVCTGGLGPRRKSAAGRGVDQRSSCRTSCTAGAQAAEATVSRGELEQRAGESRLRCDSNDAAPARHKSRTQSRANHSVRTCSSRSWKEPEEGGRLGTPAATNLNSKTCKNHKVESRRARYLGVATLTPWPGWALGTGMGRFMSARFGKAHIASDPSTSHLADPGDSSLEREGAGGKGAGGKGAGGRTGCSVVAERVKQTTAGAESGRERQGRDGDCFVNMGRTVKQQTVCGPA